MSFRVFIGNNIKIEVNKMVHHFITGLIQGMKETPRGYFAPAIAVWRLLLTTTDTLLQQKKLLSSDHHDRLNETSKG